MVLPGAGHQIVHDYVINHINKLCFGWFHNFGYLCILQIYADF